MAIIAITTSNSISVNARREYRGIWKGFRFTGSGQGQPHQTAAGILVAVQVRRTFGGSGKFHAAAFSRGFAGICLLFEKLAAKKSPPLGNSWPLLRERW
jgi:hypothetical protein